MTNISIRFPNKHLDIADPTGSAMELFKFATTTVPSTNGAKPGKNLRMKKKNSINLIRYFNLKFSSDSEFTLAFQAVPITSLIEVSYANTVRGHLLQDLHDNL